MATDLNDYSRSFGAASDELQQALAAHRHEKANILQSNLAADQRRRELAASYAAVRDRVRHLQRADREAVETAGQRAVQRAFAPPPLERNNPSAILAARDAADRARQLRKPSDAHGMLDDALAHGDGSLARAIASHAYRQGWHDVTGKWAETQPPSVMDHLNDATAAATLQGPAARIARSMAYTVPVPSELSGMTEGQIRQLASQAAGNYG